MSDPCYDRGITFRPKCFLNDGGALLNPKSSEIDHFFFMILVVYLVTQMGLFIP